MAVEEEESEEVAAAAAAVGRAACWVRTCSTAGPRSCVSTSVPTRDGWSAPRARTSLLCPRLSRPNVLWLHLTRSVPRARRRRCRSRHCAGCSAAREGSSWAYSPTASRSSGMSEAPCWKRHSSPRAPRPPLGAVALLAWGGAAPAYRPKSSILISVWVFILSFYDGRLEALLDEVTRAGAAPVAASVKREIVRQHLQLQVFEAVPA